MNQTAELVPSAWLCRYADRIRQHGVVLDVASGHGRNARWLAAQGFAVEAVDIDQVAACIDGRYCRYFDKGRRS